jgi:hypothetical protein
MTAGQQAQRRRARRAAFWLLLVALAVYFGFIFTTVLRSRG